MNGGSLIWVLDLVIDCDLDDIAPISCDGRAGVLPIDHNHVALEAIRSQPLSSDIEGVLPDLASVGALRVWVRISSTPLSPGNRLSCVNRQELRQLWSLKRP